MARPRVFISSTCYDLKYIRTELERFLKDHLGYEPVLSEKGDIAWKSSQPLEASCYDEVKNCQIFVLIIGGRYGSASMYDLGDGDEFTADKSVTMNEYLTAARNDTPVYVFIESDVYAEYRTFKKNAENKEIEWAQVDDSKVYKFIEHIESQQMNNPIHSFKEVDDIINHLKSQFAGLFKDFLTTQGEQQPINRLDTKIDELTNMFQLILKSQSSNATGDLGNTAEIVKEISEALRVRDEERAFHSSDTINHMIEQHGLSKDEIKDLYDKAVSYSDFIARLKVLMDKNTIVCHRLSWNPDADLKYHLNSRKPDANSLQKATASKKDKK